MILGNAISAIGVSMNTIGKEFTENANKIEVYLAMGASRFEACRPVAIEALKLALLPTINQMSVIGLISIPGMMTGAIVGGKSVEQAARLQSAFFLPLLLHVQIQRANPSDHHVQCVAFILTPLLQERLTSVISASSALCTLAALVFALSTIVDNHARIRPDRLDSRSPAFYRWRDGVFKKMVRGIKSLRCWGGRVERGSEEERRGLIQGEGS